MDVGPRCVEPGEDEHLIAERSQGPQDRRELEAASHRRRRPVLPRHPVRHEDRLKAADRLDRGPCQRRHGRHGVQERERHGRAHAAQDRPTGQGPRGDDVGASHVIPLVGSCQLGVVCRATPNRNNRLTLFRRPPHQERRALDDPENDRRPAMPVRGRIANDAAHRRPVVVPRLAPEGVSQAPFGKRPHEPPRHLEPQAPPSGAAGGYPGLAPSSPEMATRSGSRILSPSRITSTSPPSATNAPIPQVSPRPWLMSASRPRCCAAG